jgi:hypothetical protein
MGRLSSVLRCNCLHAPEKRAQAPAESSWGHTGTGTGTGTGSAARRDAGAQRGAEAAAVGQGDVVESDLPEGASK